MRDARFFRTVLMGLSVLALSASGQLVQADEEVLTVGSKAPDLEIEHWVSDGRGKFQPVESFEEGKVYVVEFWATWCGPCISSMPHLAETQEKFAEKGVQIVSISDEDIDTVEKFLKRPVRKPGAAPAAKADGDEEAPVDTYGDLTSAYCLTTDPDRSNHKAYMEAAAQNGIPTCFIVGKSGLIEWIGHPMAMDKPLLSIVSDSWDRAVFLAEFEKEQARDILMAKISKKMRAGDTDGALKVVREVKSEAEADVQTLATMNRIEAQILLTPIMKKVQTGDQEEAITEMKAAMENADKDVRPQMQAFGFRMLMSTKKTDAAAAMLNEIASAETVSTEDLNSLAWSVFQMAQRDKEFPEAVRDAATAAAERAVNEEPKNGMLLDTLAHLVYLKGDLDRAIELQTLAVANPPEGQAVSSGMTDFLEALKKEKAGE